MAVKWRKGLKYDLDVDPAQEDVFYEFDWTEWLAEVQATTITSADVTANPSTVTISNIVVQSGTVVVFKIANSTAVVGDEIMVTMVANTANTQSKPKSITFVITNS